MDAARGGLTKLLSNAIRGRQAGFFEIKNLRLALRIAYVLMCACTPVESSGCVWALLFALLACSVCRGSVIFRDRVVWSVILGQLTYTRFTFCRYLCYLGIRPIKLQDRTILLVVILS